MEIELIKNNKNMVEFSIKGERHTFSNLLKSRLLEDKSVEFASYLLEHPTDNSAKFILATKGKTPKKALEDAIKKIDDDLSEFEDIIKKAVK